MLQPREPGGMDVSDVRDPLGVVSHDVLPVLVVDRPPPGWHIASNARAGSKVLERLEAAVATRRDAIAGVSVQKLLTVIHADRTAAVRDTALRERLTLEAAGTGRLVDPEATIHTPLGAWRVRPLGPRTPGDLPPGAEQALRAWQSAGELFDGLYMGEQDAGRCLAGVISPDGVAGEWFLLARWTV